jgi:hypothetical protein
MKRYWAGWASSTCPCPLRRRHHPDPSPYEDHRIGRAAELLALRDTDPYYPDVRFPSGLIIPILCERLADRS